MVKEFVSKEIDKRDFKITFFDFHNDIDDGQTTISPSVSTKNITLSKIDDDTNLKELVAVILKETIEELNDIPKLYKSNDPSFKNKLKLKLEMISNYIAAVGRINKANTIVLNSDTRETYKDSLSEDYLIVENNNIPNDTFYLIYNNDDLTVPGFKFLYHKAGDELFGDVINVGFHPEKQCAKLVIYEN